MSFEMIYNRKTNKDLDFTITTRPNIPSPTPRYNEIDVDGADGKYIEKTDNYEDIEIEVSCSFNSKNSDKWNTYFRKIKRWLYDNNSDNILRFSDDQGYFYKVKKADIEDSERKIKILGTFKIKFVCDPYSYLDCGLDEIELPNNIDNDYEISKPQYRIEGNGTCMLNINGTSIACLVDNDGLILDTELGLCYKRSDKSFANNKVIIREWSDLFIKKAENTFSKTDGFNVYITPNWREL